MKASITRKDAARIYALPADSALVVFFLSVCARNSVFFLAAHAHTSIANQVAVDQPDMACNAASIDAQRAQGYVP